MPLNFPSSPTTNQSYSLGSKTWIYNGYGWKLQQVTLANTEVSSFTATADGVTSTFDLQFSPIGGNSAVFVSIGGVVQSENDYVINSGNNSISFTSPPPASELIRVAGYKTVIPYAVDAANSIGAVVNANNFVGDGTTQSFALGYTPYTANNIFVSIGGIIQPDSAYSTNNQNSSISFNTPPGVGENIRVVGYSKVNPFIISYVTQNVSVSVFETTSNGTTSTFNVGFDPTPKEKLLVTIDGIVQPLNSYYVAQSNSAIILDETPLNGEVVRVVTFYTNVNTVAIQLVAANVTVKNFETTANGLVDSFDLGYRPTSNLTLIVSIDGVLQAPSTYSVNPSANSITFDATPAPNEYITVTTLSNAANVYVIDDGSITFNKLQSTVNNKIDLALNQANSGFNQANAGFGTANSAGIYANGAFVTANAAATTGKAIAMSIVFGG
jgi:hypothetical protein